jgi:hypothetical protein
VNQGADDPNLVYVYFPGTSATRLKEFTENPALHEAMENAGVQGPPSITFVTPSFSDLRPGEGLAVMIASHAVEDYDHWRAAYDDLDEYRRQLGIVGHAVHQVVGEPNRIVVYHQADGLETLQAFVASAVLAEAMQKAGVVGPPDIQLVRAVDWVEYPEGSLAARGADSDR